MFRSPRWPTFRSMQPNSSQQAVPLRPADPFRVLCTLCEHTEFVHGDFEARRCLYSECGCSGFTIGRCRVEACGASERATLGAIEPLCAIFCGERPRRRSCGIRGRRRPWRPARTPVLVSFRLGHTTTRMMEQHPAGRLDRLTRKSPRRPRLGTCGTSAARRGHGRRRARRPHPLTCDSWSGRRDSNPRPPPWQGGALPLSHVRRLRHHPRHGDSELQPVAYETPVEPKPPAPLWDSGSSSTNAGDTSGRATITSCAIRSPAAISTGSWRSRFTTAQTTSPR